jgi:hypothetical protein
MDQLGCLIVKKNMIAFVRWTLDQLYVSKAIHTHPDVNINKKNGATVSIRKRGWGESWNLAKKLAGWY